MTVDRKDATGREAMSLLADGLESNDNPIAQRFVRAVRSAERAPRSDGNRAYNTEFLIWMGLAQSEPGRPSKPFPVDDLERFLRRSPDVTNNSLKKAMNAVDEGISETRALSYIVRARERISSGHYRLPEHVSDHHQALLIGDNADEGRAIFCRESKASIDLTSALVFALMP